MENFQVVEYVERLEVTLKGEYRLTHDGGSLSVIPARVKKLSPEEARAWFERLFPGRSWKRIVREVNEWRSWESIGPSKKNGKEVS